MLQTILNILKFAYQRQITLLAKAWQLTLAAGQTSVRYLKFTVPIF